MTKQEQRTFIKQLLRGKSEEYLNESAALACARFVCLPQFIQANTILAYMAMRRECNPSQIVETAHKLGIAVAFPLCTADNRLQICVPNDTGAFITGAYGICEPDPNRSSILSPNDIDLIVVPGLGFDSSCARLGRGAGYYDRLLSESRAYKVGFCFDEQVFDNVATEPHDVPLDCVITPNRSFFRY